ncbi:hypothetical protein ASD00_31045 [Ensifer sp. Root31]|uniref:DUF2938 domain-containing protein n=1 Tax=Ensifer sp. Root31 TaxID=1736512 RepID=UPI00070BCE8B|nr:DUF2938 domain-containing protein [Ensifer sp. Root31]KQU86335.1 hypothetical protein ASD00_31045 [Ensifer sp. Root31]
MNEVAEFVVRAVAIGVGATVVLDLWAIILKRAFSIPSLDYRLVGRWLANMPKGKFMHTNIIKTAPAPGEVFLGWTAHYAIGVLFAALMLGAMRPGWATEPTFWPALITGVVSLAAPFFIMQPAFGFGIAASKTPAPNTARMRSIMNHAVFGVGLYIAAVLAAWAV